MITGPAKGYRTRLTSLLAGKNLTGDNRHHTGLTNLEIGT